MKVKRKHKKKTQHSIRGIHPSIYHQGAVEQWSSIRIIFGKMFGVEENLFFIIKWGFDIFQLISMGHSIGV